MLRYQLTFLQILILNIVAAQNIKVEKAPSWIKNVNYPKTSQVSKYDVQSGVYNTLIDFQSNFKEESSYFHQVQKIVNSGGVSVASKLQLEYDSAYQKIVLHRLTIWRNEKEIDKLNELKIEYIKNEQELQSNIYSGYVTALIIINDVRKNDLLEVAYTIVGSNPVYKGANYELFPLGDTNPVDKLNIRVIYPSNSKYFFKCHGCEENAVIKREDGQNTVLSFERNDLMAVEIENTSPPWVIPFDYFEVSNTNKWEEVNQWAMKLFDNHEDDQIEELFAEIFYPKFSLEDKINSIINFVQDDIRYMGIESGMGNVIPFSPNKTIKQRFGDCKDKSLLLVSMLRKIGINESYVALVNSSLQHNISQFIPNGQIFNHCIVYFKHLGNDYWIDPTVSFQGGSFSEIMTYDYGKALIIQKDTKSLSTMNVQNNNGKSVVLEEFDLSTFGSDGTLKIFSTMNGFKADQTRQILEYYSKKELAEAFKYPLGLLYPSLVESKKLIVKENEKRNIINTEENYSIPNAWIEDGEGYYGQYQFRYEPSGITNYIYQMNCEVRKFPVFVDFPAKYEQTTLFKLPQIIYIDTLKIKYNNEAFEFEKKTKMLDSKTIEVKYMYQSKAKEIKPETFTQVCYDMNDILNGLRITFSYPKPRYTNSNSAMNYHKSNPFLFKGSQENLKSYTLLKQNFLSKQLNKEDQELQENIDGSLKNSYTYLENNDGIIVDEQPSYPGGIGKFYKKINKSLKYPKLAKKNGISGKVFVSFVVNESGNINDLKVVNGIDLNCDEEAMRVIKAAGNWNPGKSNGKNVAVRMILPITFKL